jgi:hypothetical protein
LAEFSHYLFLGLFPLTAEISKNKTFNQECEQQWCRKNTNRSDGQRVLKGASEKLEDGLCKKLQSSKENED